MLFHLRYLFCYFRKRFLSVSRYKHRWVKIITDWVPNPGHRSKCRPRCRWRDDLEGFQPNWQPFAEARDECKEKWEHLLSNAIKKNLTTCHRHTILMTLNGTRMKNTWMNDISIVKPGKDGLHFALIQNAKCALCINLYNGDRLLWTLHNGWMVRLKCGIRYIMIRDLITVYEPKKLISRKPTSKLTSFR